MLKAMLKAPHFQHGVSRTAMAPTPRPGLVWRNVLFLGQQSDARSPSHPIRPITVNRLYLKGFNVLGKTQTALLKRMQTEPTNDRLAFPFTVLMYTLANAEAQSSTPVDSFLSSRRKETRRGSSFFRFLSVNLSATHCIKRTFRVSHGTF